MIVVAFIVLVVLVYINMIGQKLKDSIEREEAEDFYRKMRNDKDFMKKIGG